MPEYNFKFDWNKISTLGKVRILVEQVVGSPSQAQISQAVADYIDSHPGALSPLSQATKSALLTIAEKVAYVDENGQSYYDALDAALNAKALLNITAVYTQSGTVYDTDSLDSLKSDLVVTANYDDGTTANVTSASTLSGTLAEGTSTITATYQEKTATFTVTVTRDVFGTKLYSHYNEVYDGTNRTVSALQLWEDDIDFSVFVDITPDGNTSEQIVFKCNKNGAPYNGIKFSAHNGYYKLWTYYSATPQTAISPVPSSTTTNAKFAITHEKGSNVYRLYSLYNGSVTVKTTTTQFLTNDVQLTIASDNLTSQVRPWYGTLHALEVFDKAWTSEEVNEKLGV